jgi:hypothetical protein
LHTKGLGESLIFVDVDFYNLHLVAEGVFGFLQNGRHGFAWSAPRGVEINEGRDVGLYEFIELHNTCF